MATAVLAILLSHYLLPSLLRRKWVSRTDMPDHEEVATRNVPTDSIGTSRDPRQTTGGQAQFHVNLVLCEFADVSSVKLGGGAVGVV